MHMKHALYTCHFPSINFMGHDYFDVVSLHICISVRYCGG
jgi:hypothetical protein